MEYCTPEFLRGMMNASSLAGRPFFFAVDYEMTRGIFIPGDSIAESPVKFRFPSFGNAGKRAFPRQDCRMMAFPEPFRSYEKKFEKVARAILRGDTYLANLTVRTPVSISASLEDIFNFSGSEFAMLAPGSFVCFSPERFVRIAGGMIYSFPMKGTIEADAPGAEKILMGDEKEICEHNTIVDLIRNDLSMIASDVRVPRFRYCERIKRAGLCDIFATSSEICGALKPIGLGDAVFSILPAGSISGAPKKRTVEILKETEGRPRGFYTGVFGYFDGKNFDSAVAIRFIEQDGGKYYYRSGGGITANSGCESEYREAAAKIYLPF